MLLHREISVSRPIREAQFVQKG